MTQRWLLIMLLTTHLLLPAGGGLCPCMAAPAVAVPQCGCGCETAAPAECCGDGYCCGADRDSADEAAATLTEVSPTPVRVLVLAEALAPPVAVPLVRVLLERRVTPRDLLICATRAQRAPPA